jgi:hypothetical protein
MAETSNPFQAWYDYSDMTHKWRGYVINHAIDLEQVMENFIAKHYIIGINDEDYDQKLEDFKNTFFWITSMGLGNKMKITKKLIELYQPDIHKMYPEVNIYAELDEIIETRNAMAHWQLDFSKEYRWNGAKNKQMKIERLNKLKTGGTTIYSEESINRIVELCRKYTTILLHWSFYPTTNALPTIFYETEERLSKLTEAERARLKNEYKTGL